MTVFLASLLSEFNHQVGNYTHLNPHLMSSSDLRKQCQGEITQAEALHYRTGVPKKEGLFL